MSADAISSGALKALASLDRDNIELIMEALSHSIVVEEEVPFSTAMLTFGGEEWRRVFNNAAEYARKEEMHSAQ